jgi:hypothetical protein
MSEEIPGQAEADAIAEMERFRARHRPAYIHPCPDCWRTYPSKAALMRHQEVSPHCGSLLQDEAEARRPLLRRIFGRD